MGRGRRGGGAGRGRGARRGGGKAKNGETDDNAKKGSVATKTVDNEKSGAMESARPSTMETASPSLSQLVPSSCPVDMEDTFDKLTRGVVRNVPVKQNEDVNEDMDFDESGGIFGTPPDILGDEPNL